MHVSVCTHKHNTHTHRINLTSSVLGPFILGVVTAELCRNKEEGGDDIMSKMVEDLDEVSHVDISSLVLTLNIFN